MSLSMTIAVVLFGGLIVALILGRGVRRRITTAVTIDGTPQEVWSVLADHAAYGDWNPFVRDMQGRLSAGERIRITLQLGERAPQRFAPRVLVADPGAELRWQGRLFLPGLFDGTHSFVLEDMGQGATRLHHSEHFAGLLVPLIFGLIGAETRRGFDAMNAALKARVEAASRNAA